MGDSQVGTAGTLSIYAVLLDTAKIPTLRKVAVVFTSTNSSNVHVLPSLMGKKWHVGFNLLEFLTSSFKNLPIFIFLVSICWLLPLLLAPHPQCLQSQNCATYNNVTQSRSPNTGGKAGGLSLLLLLKGVRQYEAGRGTQELQDGMWVSQLASSLLHQMSVPSFKIF